MTTTNAPPLPFDAADRSGVSSRWLRRGAVALLVGGPLSLAFHVLWQLGHGPTIVNEHGVVLGLTNDQWSYLSGAWRAPVAVGVVLACSLYGGPLRMVARVLVVAGLALGAVAVKVWTLYSLATLILYAGMLCLAVLILRGSVLPRWSGAALLLAVVSFLPVMVAPDAVFSASTERFGLLLQAEDLIAFCAALGWTVLGFGLARNVRLT